MMSAILDMFQQITRDRRATSRKAQPRAFLPWVPAWGRIPVAIIALLVLAFAGVLSWPYLEYSMIAAGLWLLAALLILRWRPSLLLRRVTLWVGSAVMVGALAGALSLYGASYGGVLTDYNGGSLGGLISGPIMSSGVPWVVALLLVGLVIMAPGKTLRAWRSGITYAVRAIRAVAPYVAAAAVAAVRGTAYGLGLAVRLALRFAWGLISGYRAHPLHRPLLAALRAAVAAPARRRKVGEKPQEASLPEIPELEELPAWLADQYGIEYPETPEDNVDEDAGLAEAPESPTEEEPSREPNALSVPATQAPARTSSRWVLPSTDLLRSVGRRHVSQDDTEEKSRLIERTLADYGVEVKVDEVRPGPVVTQFGLVPGWVRRTQEVVERDDLGNPIRDEKGRPVKRQVEKKTRVKVDNILSREKDLALALAALTIRFEAPVPGESFVGLEVPNAHPEIVTLRSLVESDAFEKLRPRCALPIALGKGSGGEAVVTDLADMPHLLIAGATGSGKSVCMNTIICSLLMQNTPQQLRLFLVDPKRVELTVYNETPHLLAPVLVDTEKIVPALRGIIGEMNARYKRFEAARVRNIGDYNSKAATPDEWLAYIVLVIDELADLMMTASAEVEQALCRLAQLGRATGIHLVVATQRPSVDVLTGLIKANFPSRISFGVSSQVDSRTILDGTGAEKLLGKGDMLFLPTDYIKPKRLQGAFISDDEVRGLVDHWGQQRGGPLPASTSFQMPPQQAELSETAMDLPIPEDDEALEGDETLRQARALALNHSRISAPLLQRKLGIGYPRAEGLLEKLERMGVVEPGDPGKSRTVVARRGG